MTPSDERHHDALIGPFEVRVEQVGIGILAAGLVVQLFVLFVVQPPNPVVMYPIMVATVVLIAVSAVRLRRLRRQQLERSQE
jgi:hypothetical protein